MYNVVITETAEKELKKLFKKSRIDYNNIIEDIKLDNIKLFAKLKMMD